MKDRVNVIASYDVLRDANDRRQRVVVLGGNVKAMERLKVTLGYAAMTADAAFAATSNVVTGAIPNYSSTFGVAANGSIKVATTAGGVDWQATPRLSLIGAVYNTRVSGDGIPANNYNTYALLAKYALSKRTFLYGAIDHETATTHGGLATVSGKDTNTGITAGIQTRF
jgi:predicted porin